MYQNEYETRPTGKWSLEFIHHELPVFHEVGQYDTPQQAMGAANIGKGLIKWQQRGENSWDGWGETDLGFHYTVTPGTERVRRPDTRTPWKKVVDFINGD